MPVTPFEKGKGGMLKNKKKTKSNPKNWNIPQINWNQLKV